MGDLRIGMIGLDSSHAGAFARLLNEPSNEYHVAGGKVVVAYAGGSDDFEFSHSRVEAFTREMVGQFGVQLVDSPRAVAEVCDVVFITSVDGRVHLSQLKEILPLKRPTFIDKPVATSLADAGEIYRLAGNAGVPVVSSSALRFTDAFVGAMKRGPATGGCDVFGPLPFEPTQYGWFWYGVHAIELVVAAMGVGCRNVACHATESGDALSAVWADGRVATVHGLRRGHGQFGISIHREKEAQFVDVTAGPRPIYAGLLEAIMRTLPEGKVAVSPEETMEVVKILHVANRARETAERVAL